MPPKLRVLAFFSVLPQLSCYQLWVSKAQLKMSDNDFLPHEKKVGRGGWVGGGRKEKKQRGEKSITATVTEKKEKN